jgi:hypothetical protein
MQVRRPRLPAEEIARRGTELYQQKIRPLVEAGNRGRLLMIDVETGDYELADDHDDIEACQRLIAKHPDAQIWGLRIGHRAVDRLGYHGSTEEP